MSKPSGVGLGVDESILGRADRKSKDAKAGKSTVCV